MRVHMAVFACFVAKRRHHLFRWPGAQETVFTADEKVQLAEMFSLNAEQLTTVLESCIFMLEQFAYNVAKPAAVSAALTKAGLSDEHVRTPRFSKYAHDAAVERRTRGCVAFNRYAQLSVGSLRRSMPLRKSTPMRRRRWLGGCATHSSGRVL